MFDNLTDETLLDRMTKDFEDFCVRWPEEVWNQYYAWLFA